jgi:hypothetical protein
VGGIGVGFHPETALFPYEKGTVSILRFRMDTSEWVNRSPPTQCRKEYPIAPGVVPAAKVLVA